jgi:hypothetical protein
MYQGTFNCSVNSGFRHCKLTQIKHDEGDIRKSGLEFTPGALFAVGMQYLLESARKWDIECSVLRGTCQIVEEGTANRWANSVSSQPTLILYAPVNVSFDLLGFARGDCASFPDTEVSSNCRWMLLLFSHPLVAFLNDLTPASGSHFSNLKSKNNVRQKN